jgi:hypothetical protein
MPTLTAIAFYTANIAAITGYGIALALTLRHGGPRGHGTLPAATRIAALMFFCACTGIHLELAALVYTQTPLVDPVTKEVPWHFLSIVILKVVAVYTFLLHSLAAPERPPLAPPDDSDPCADLVAEAIAMEAVAAVNRQAREAREEHTTT